MCNCKNIDPASPDCFSQQIVVEIPAHMHAYRIANIAARRLSTVNIDPCCFAEIWLLWKHGIITFGCCCGHNKEESFVNVHSKDIPWMLEQGYVQNHPDPNRKDTFKLKSC